MIKSIEDTRPIYVHYFRYNDENFIFDTNKFNPVKNIPGFGKPEGGYWACREDELEGFMEFDGRWAETCGGWCRVNPHRFKLKENARVLYLRNKEDLRKLKAIECNSDRYLQIGAVTDFEALSREYDAIEILDINPFYYILYGWDFNSILIMNPDVIETIEVSNEI